ncbi:hypothetical protein [Nocardia sp. CS682]|uniref:hypothetical protein n=1 Tax=Nocardia sp. CS682 TaxID=1047172 RepID=UPI0010754434|nr:hypothetical protein [Nocardia sp. CS682]QBS40391.1 hypothetical protein DMB37_09950 [Nocardia sp. CS682]
MTDWELHTKAQADEIAAKKRQLAKALGERDELHQKYQVARNSLGNQATTITKQTTTIDQAITLPQRPRKKDH